MSLSMIGTNTIDIDWKNFVSGMSSSNFSQDAGFSPGNAGVSSTKTVVNPLAVPGLIYPPGPTTDHSTNLTGEMICSCEDPSGSAVRLFISTDAQQDGRFFSYASNGVLTERGAEDTAGNYIYGRSDMIAFQSEVYVTNSDNIVRWQQPNTFNYTFFTFSDAFAPHPAIVYEDNAFYGDGNLLLRQTSAGSAPSTILTLPTNQVIVALGIDPGSGMMLISVVDQYNVSGTINSQARVLYYDGFSNKARKVVLVDDMILAFYNVGSTMYITYGQKLGYWTGAGIQFLRTLEVSFDNAELPYKHHITNIGEILYVITRTYILAYGEIVKGAGNSFYYCLRNSSGDSGNYTLVTNIGQNTLAVSFATGKLFTFDTTNVSEVLTGGAYFRTLKYHIERKVTFTQCVIQFGAAIPTSDNIGTLYLITDDGELTEIGTLNTSTIPANIAISGNILGTANGTTATFTFQSAETRTIQVLWVNTPSNATKVCPIQRITLFSNPK